MIICFECPARTKTLLDNIVGSGQYKDYAEAISSAIENLSVLQNELSHKGVLVIEARDQSISPNPQPRGRKTAKGNGIVRRSKRASTQGRSPELETTLATAPTRVPKMFLLDGIGESLPSPASPPDDIWAKGQEVPLDRWIFGQYNKLLPAKASCRALAHLLNDKPDGIPLDEAASRISEEALTLGLFLAYHDRQNGTARDEALSTAFPSLSREVEKSRLRFANQFVASINKQGQMSGLLIDLKLVNRIGRTPHLKLTEAGWRFATLPNLILDAEAPETTRKFTREEESFLLNHISNSVPIEDFAYRAILTAVAEGATTPEKLDSALQRYVSQDAERNLTKSFLTSQRSGAVSRMADLDLIARVRDGVRVSYVVTNLGKQYV